MENKTGVNMQDIFELANSLQGTNFQDEESVRQVIKRVAAIAGRNVSPEVEDKLVNSIVNGGEPMDMTTITEMMNKTMDER